MEHKPVDSLELAQDITNKGNGENYFTRHIDNSLNLNFLLEMSRTRQHCTKII